MKTFLLLAFSFSIALAQVVNAEDQDQAKVKAAPKTRSHVQAPKHVAPQHVGPQHVGPQHVGPSQTTVSKTPHINKTTVQPNQYHPKVQSTARVHTNPTIPNAPKTSTTVQANTNARNKNWQNKTNQNNNNQNTTLQKKNWQKNQTVNNNSWTEARRRHGHEHHDRNWWRSHFTRFALFGSGYYFWDNNYWYPAYGYDSGYNTYDYNEPIYGYNNLEPARVISNVQTELQRLGYYHYAVDGQMGPATRAAIANYQRDTGLAITSAIDEPTLQSLGLD
jgi:peptidoglycan hydrolase-like protein with peptidoglycan-binding domain